MESDYYLEEYNLVEEIRTGFTYIVEPRHVHKIVRDLKDKSKLCKILEDGFKPWLGSSVSTRQIIVKDISPELLLQVGAEGVIVRVEEPDEGWLDIEEYDEERSPGILVTVDWGNGDYVLYGDYGDGWSRGPIWLDPKKYERNCEYGGFKIENFNGIRIKRIIPPKDTNQLELGVGSDKT